MDAKEFDAIGTLIESRILQMTPERRDSMIHFACLAALLVMRTER